jgi:hypothetical protein
VVDQSRMAGLRWEQRHHDMQNCAYIYDMILYLKHSKDKDLKCPFDNYWSPHINILKIEMGFSANSSWTYDESNDQIFWFDKCRKIPFLFLKYWYGDFSNCRKGILNPYLYYAFNNESCMTKFQAIIYPWSFVEIKMLGLRYVAGGRCSHRNLAIRDWSTTSR